MKLFATSKTQHSSSMATTDPQKAAANFQRDILYNPELRAEFFDAVSNIVASRVETSVNTLLANNNYKCTYADLGDGYKQLLTTTLLPWSSLYNLRKTGEAGDGIDHTCLIVGSRTDLTVDHATLSTQTTISFDSDLVVGFTTTLENLSTQTLPTIAWSENADREYNVELTFVHSTPPEGDPNVGVRQIQAKIWTGDEKPDEYTHAGNDVFSDVAQFSGSYATSIANTPGVLQGGEPITVEVDSSHEDGIIVNVTLTNSGVKLVTGAKATENTVTWSSSDNEEYADKLIGTLAAYRQGYINFSWLYQSPPVGSKELGKTLQCLQGAVWPDGNDSFTRESKTFVGNILPDSHTGDIPIDDALRMGEGVSITLFLVLIIGIGFSIRSLIKWSKKLRENLTKTDLNDSDRAAADSAVKGAASNIKMVSKDVQRQDITDVNDVVTYKKIIGEDGKQMTSERTSLPLFEDPNDPNNALEKFTDARGDHYLLVNRNTGEPLTKENVPEMKSSIFDAVTGQLRAIFSKFSTVARAFRVNVEERLEEVSPSNGDILRGFDEEKLKVE